MLMALVMLALAFTPVCPVVAATSADGPQPTLLDVVIAADESGSLADEDVRREVQAARYIVLGSGLNPASRVTVIGFGSENDAGGSAIDEVCPPRAVSTPADRAALTACVGKLHRRSAAEGNDTDHATALTQAISYFRSSSLQNARRTVFLLTDGRLDVQDSSKYGSVLANRNDNAMGVVEQELKRAAQFGVQVWPLGFGSADVTQLQRFAAGASSGKCSSQTGPPAARVIRDSTDLQAALLDAFRRAVCVSVEGPIQRQVQPGASTDIKVTVPVIATDGTILVGKGSKVLKITYLDPDSKPVPTQGTSGGSTFSLSGQDSETESLRIADPRPGTYTVHVEAGRELSSQLVQVVALWQGAVRAAVYTSPATATPSQKVVVHVSLRSRSGPVTAPDALKGMAVAVGVGEPGPGGAFPQMVEMRNDGQGGDETAGDGEFTGSLTAPDAAGRRSLTAIVTGPGIHAEPLVTTLLVQEPSAAISADLSFDVPPVVRTGESIRGRLSARNDRSTSVPVRLELRDADGLLSLQKPQALTLQPGPSQVDVTLVSAVGGPAGRLDAQVVVVDAADIATVYGSAPLRSEVRKPPGMFERWFWGFVAAGALLLLVLGLLGARWFSALQRHRVAGLVVQIVDTATGRVARSQKAPAGWAQTLRFSVVSPADPLSVNPPQLMTSSTQQGVRYAVRRRDGGKVTVVVDGTGQEELVVGRDTLLLDNARYVLRIAEAKATSGTDVSAAVGAGRGWKGAAGGGGSSWSSGSLSGPPAPRGDPGADTQPAPETPPTLAPPQPSPPQPAADQPKSPWLR